MIAPVLRSIIEPATAWQQRNALLRLRSITSSQRSSRQLKNLQPLNQRAGIVDQDVDRPELGNRLLRPVTPPRSLG